AHGRSPAPLRSPTAPGPHSLHPVTARTARSATPPLLHSARRRHTPTASSNHSRHSQPAASTSARNSFLQPLPLRQQLCSRPLPRPAHILIPNLLSGSGLALNTVADQVVLLPLLRLF